MKKRLLPVLVILVVALAVFGWRWWTDYRFEQTTDDAYVEGDITHLSAKVAGHVAGVLAADNQTVKEGDVLLRLDDRDHKARRDEVAALVAARSAQLEQLDDKVAVQLALLTQAGAGISAAQADLVRSRADLERTRALVRDDYASRQRFDKEAADALKAEAGVKGSAAGASAIKRQVAVLDSDRAIAIAQLDQAKAQLDLAESDLDATIIRAPIDGIVGNRAARLGSYVRPGQHLVTVVPVHGLWIEANYKETQLTHIHPGQTVRLKVDAFPDVELVGRVASFSPASGAKFSLLPPENATGNFTKVVQRVPVRIELPADHPLIGRLAPGLSVVATVRTGP